jgi:hypothetical protein
MQNGQSSGDDKMLLMTAQCAYDRSAVKSRILGKM